MHSSVVCLAYLVVLVHGCPAKDMFSWKWPTAGIQRFRIPRAQKFRGYDLNCLVSIKNAILQSRRLMNSKHDCDEQEGIL